MKKVVVTGLGCISALGHDVASNWQAMREGQCGIGPLALEPADMFKSPIAAQVKTFPSADEFSHHEISRLDRFSLFGLTVAREAIEDAGLQFTAELQQRTAVIMGSGIGGMGTLDDGFRRLYHDNKHRLNPLTVPRVMLSAPASAISMDHGITGPCFSVSSACSSTNHAIAQAFQMLRSGNVDIVIAGGSEACLTPGLIKSWEALKVLAGDTCRPFSLDRKGIVLGEGAGVLVLESLDHAQQRGASIYAELAGCGLSSDAADLLKPNVNGAVQAMVSALRDAELSASDIDYINAHGTGTLLNDITETHALHQVFGAHAEQLAVSSTKSMHGHALGASGGIEAIATVKAIFEGIIPPTVNYTRADPECDLDYVPNTAREQPVKAALSNSFAFGGLNAVLAFKQFTPSLM